MCYGCFRALIENFFPLILPVSRTLSMVFLMSFFRTSCPKFFEKNMIVKHFRQKTASLEDELRHQSVKALVERRRNNIEIV